MDDPATTRGQWIGDQQSSKLRLSALQAFNGA
jgi:hypothetical protein